MTKERSVHPAVRALLMSGEEFEYAHLIKFERPTRPDSRTGRVSTSAQRYTHITDASRDITFDDKSFDLFGYPNGPQTYIANKVLKVSDVAEATEAKASNFSLTLDGNGLGAELMPQTMTITASDTGYFLEIHDKNVDPVYEGFREGDKISLNGARFGTFNILKFRENNVISLAKIDQEVSPGTGTIGITLASEEIKSILSDKNAAEYASFTNREVFIYKIFQQDGVTVGEPFLLFKGIISNVGFDDDERGIVVTWGLTSHWGDFGQVKGRLTSDDFHRALDENGVPQPQSALKAIYAYDKGFAHAETSVNLLSTYTVQVEQQAIKSKKGFLGIGAKVKVKKYLVPEDRHTDLDFQLSAKAIPVIYGVRNTVGIPIFADTLKSDSSEVYVVYALCEGEIGGIYDVYINGQSLICNDASDFDTRSKQNADNTIEVVCRGRSDRGDVLGGQTSIDPDPVNSVDFFESLRDQFVWSQYYNKNALTNYQPYIPPSPVATTSNIGRGIIHGESISLNEPIAMTLDFFSGTEGQKAASQLVEIAKAGNFKVQNDYWEGADTAEYWGPNHRLADTAYVVAKYKIKEGDTSIPDIEFIARCKVIDCYNYDYSYAHDEKVTGQNADTFPLGSTVSLYTAGGVLINADTQIIDKWTFTRPDGVLETRFRFDQIPNLGYIDGIPTTTRFYMSNGSSQWHMTTFNYVIHAGTVGAEISTTVTSLSDDAGNLAIDYQSNNLVPVGGDPSQPSPIYSVLDDNGNTMMNGALYSGSTTNTRLKSKYLYNEVIRGHNIQ